MPNLLQKAIYNISSASPLCITFGYVWWTQYHTWIIPLICTFICVIFICSLKYSFTYYKRNLPPIKIRVNEFAPLDNYMIAFVFSYIVPFASMVLQDINLMLSGSIAVVVIVLALFVNSAMPNPLLCLCGYHFYSIKTEHGASEFVLISKRKIRNKNDIKCIQRIYEFLLLDKEGTDV